VRARLLSCLVAALLAAALCASVAVAGKSGGGRGVTYRGQTAQKKPIKVKGASGSLSLVSFQIRMLCHDGSFYFASVSGFEPTPVKRGRFSDTEYGATDVVEWEGTVRAARITGRVKVEDRLPSGIRCGSGPVKFTARAG
jgi:hypothetical protein